MKEEWLNCIAEKDGWGCFNRLEGGRELQVVLQIRDKVGVISLNVIEYAMIK